MKIFVKTLKGSHFDVEVKPEDTPPPPPVPQLLLKILLKTKFLAQKHTRRALPTYCMYIHVFLQKLLHSQICRLIKPQRFIAKSNFSKLSGNDLHNLRISNEVLAVINSGRPFEPALAVLSPLLNREIVISVLQSHAQSDKDPINCFRFFIWASKESRLLSVVSNNLMVDMLLSGRNVNSLDLCWSVLDEMRNERRSISAGAFAILILGYWRLQNAEKAVETFGRMKDYECKPNLYAYNVILNVLVKKDMILLALAVYNVMLKSDIRMDCCTFNVLIAGLCKNGMSRTALNLFDEMTSIGILPSSITYTVIISGLCKAKRTHEAHSLFHLMIHSGSKPDPATYNTLIDGYCKQGQINEACMLLKSFLTSGYDVTIEGFNCLIDGLVKANRFDEAEELVKKVVDVGLEPDVILYNIMMRGLTVAGRMNDGMNMFRQMLGKGIAPNIRSYNALIKGLCDLGLLDKARSFLLELPHHGLSPDTYTYNILIRGFCKKGMVVEAKQIFNDMEKQGCSPSVVTFNTLIDGLCKDGKLEEAKLMLYKMEVGKSTASLQKKVENMMESGLILQAYNLLKNSGVVPDVQTYNTLINGMCKAGHVSVALKLLEELQLKGYSPDSVTLVTLADALQRVDRDWDAYNLFERMNGNGFRPNREVYKTFMVWSLRKGKTNVAISFWLKYLKSRDGVEDEVLRSIRECFEKGEFVDAVRRLLEMDVRLRAFDWTIYSIWLTGLCQSKRAEEAAETFFVLEEFNVTVSAPACVHLIRSLYFVGELSKAVDVLNYTKQKGYTLTDPLLPNGEHLKS